MHLDDAWHEGLGLRAGATLRDVDGDDTVELLVIYRVVSVLLLIRDKRC